MRTAPEEEEGMDGVSLVKGAKGLVGLGSALWKFLARRPGVPRRTLRLVPDEHDSWWHMGAMKGQPAMQISAHWYATNITQAPVHIVRVRLLKPNTLGQVLVQHPNSNVFGSYPLLPGRMTAVITDFFVQPPRKPEGKPFSARVEFTDNLGNRHKSKRVTFSCRVRAKPEDAGPPREPVYAITDPVVKKVVSVLKAEIDRYAAFGRPSGGLGSVQTLYDGKTLKAVGSDWREVDSPAQQEVVATPAKGAIQSEHVEALLGIWQELQTPEERETFIQSLLARIARGTEYSAVAYLIGLALFRVEKLEDGLAKARKDLAGDDVHGFSNLLRVIDGLLRFEHVSFSDELLDQLERSLEGVDEHLFRIPQRIAAIRAYRLKSPGAP